MIYCLTLVLYPLALGLGSLGLVQLLATWKHSTVWGKLQHMSCVLLAATVITFVFYLL